MTDKPAGSRQRLLKILLPVALILIAVVGTLFVVRARMDLSEPHNKEAGSIDIRVGATIPDMAFHKLGGGNLKLSDVKAKILMINFWATWCEPCMVEMPSIIELRGKYQSKGFEVLGLNLDEDPEKEVPAVVAKLKIPFPVLTDPEGKLGDSFDVHAIPLTLILNQNRKIIYIENGEREWFGTDSQAQLERWLLE